MASAKVQLIPLSRAASQLNLDLEVLSVDIDDPDIINRIGSPSVCFISKINHYDDSRFNGYAMAVLAAVARLKAVGSKIVLLYCDNIASRSCARGSLYRDLLRLADHCIVPSTSMSRLVVQYINKDIPITVIEDPSSVRLQSFKQANPSKKLRLAWFGSASNITYLCEQLGHLMSTITEAESVELVILSNSVALNDARRAFSKYLPIAKRPWSLRLARWDDSKQPEQLENVLGSSHIAWIPSNPSDSIKAGVSHNRLVDSVLSGCIPVASRMLSYLELSKVALIGDDHGNLINIAIHQYNRLALKYQNERIPIIDRFSPELNHQRWVSVLSDLTS